jgi:peroxiredoxin
LVKFGSFTVADVEMNHQPILKVKVKLTHLGKNLWMVLVLFFTYDPTSYTSDEIDQFDEFMKNLKSQLVIILGLAKTLERN